MAITLQESAFWVDEVLYRAQNPDVAASGMNAAEHFVLFGQFEGRSPNALFDGQRYLESNPDVAASGMNPLEHYIRFGGQEGRSPSALFDGTWYLESNPDVAASGMNPLEHYIRFGGQEGRSPSALFDGKWYLDSNPDVAASGMNPLTHYISFGEAEGRRPVQPIFTATVDGDGTVMFSGTARGDIALNLDGATANFVREGLSATVSAFDEVNGVALSGFTLGASAHALSGVAVKGPGSLILDGIEPNTDLSRIEAVVNVTVRVAADLDLSSNANLTAVDAYAVEDGAVLTLSTAQVSGAVLIEGSYAVRDIVTNLLDGMEVGPAVAAATGGVTVIGAATVVALTALANAVAGPLAYSEVADVVANLVVAGRAVDFVKEGTDVVVTDPATLAQLAALDAANGEGALTYTTVTGLAAGLAANEGGYVTEGTDVVVTDPATLAQLAALDAANGEGALTPTTVVDSWQNILSVETQGILANATIVKLTSYALGVVTVAQVQALLALPNLQDVDGDPIDLAGLVFSLVDTPTNLALPGMSAAAIVTHATTVTADGAATVSQAVTIHERDATAVYDIADTALAITSGAQAPVTAAVDLTATTLATAAQATTILARDGAVGEVAYGIQDTFSNVNVLDGMVREAAGDIVITAANPGWPYLTTAEATTVVGYQNTERTQIDYIRGTVAQMDAFLSANPETAGSTGLDYRFWVQDSAANVLAALNELGEHRLRFMQGNSAEGLNGDHRANSVEVTSHFNVAGAETFRPAAESVYAGSTNDRTIYGINDSVAAYDNESTNGSAVTGADHLRITDSAANIHAAQNGFNPGSAQIFNLLTTRASGSDSLIVTGSNGNQTIRGTMGVDSIDVGAGDDVVWAGGGGDTITGGSGRDTLYGEAGNDLINGGSDADRLFGGDGRDSIFADDSAANTIFANAQFRGTNEVTGGAGGDNMFGSVDFDRFLFEGATRSDLRNQSGTTSQTRDYITNFNLGDQISFNSINADSVQFFGNGSANAQAVAAGTTGLSIRYEKNVEVLNWEGSGIVTASRILVDIADANGRFDDIADMHVILVGSNIDVNWTGSSLLYGG